MFQTIVKIGIGTWNFVSKNWAPITGVVVGYAVHSNKATIVNATNKSTAAVGGLFNSTLAKVTGIFKKKEPVVAEVVDIS